MSAVPPDSALPEPPDGTLEWCLVELMGHRRVAGYVREVTVAGAGFLRIDIPGDDDPAGSGRLGATQLVSPTSVYAIHPTTEDVARAMADDWHHEPVQRWELPAAVTALTGRAAGPDLDDTDEADFDSDYDSDYDDEAGL